MENKALQKVSYFPGCSLATTAKENNQTLKAVSRKLGMDLLELEDWNCCGSSSAHSINSKLAFQLACRNLSLAPEGRPLLVACPSCYLRLRTAYEVLKSDKAARRQYEHQWYRPVDLKLEILHFFEMMVERKSFRYEVPNTLKGIRIVPYYGCMLARPPMLDRTHPPAPQFFGLMEKILVQCGAEPVPWSYGSKCCGTFLSAARPDIATPMVDRIMQGAHDSGAECVVTACAMCHLNLEIRCSRQLKIPVFHFSELLSIAFGVPIRSEWFDRHVIDPVPILKSRKLLA